MAERIYVTENVYFDCRDEVLVGPGNLRSKHFQPRQKDMFLRFHDSPNRTINIGSKRSDQNLISSINKHGVEVELPKQSVIRPLGFGKYKASYYDKSEGTYDYALRNVGSSGDLARTIAELRSGGSGEEGCRALGEASWFLSESVEAKDKSLKNSFFCEVDRNIEALCANAQSVLIEYSSNTVVDVSDWPKKPYHVKSTVRKKRVGLGSDSFYECFHFSDRLRASTFKYSSIRIIDEDGVEILDLDGLPSYRKGLSEESVKERLSINGWNVSCRIRTQRIGKKKGSSIELLECVLKKEVEGEGQYKLVLRSWPCCGTEYEWIGCKKADRPKKGKEGQYFSTDVRVVAPQETKTTIELVCEFDTWSVGFSTFFTEYVFEPSIRATIEGKNADYKFALRQFSSQSPFWRRKDDKHFVTDLATEMLSDRQIAWKYSDQWLMIGEGYAIVVEASKA